ncbi:hypothetical protein ACSFCT_25655 [Yokenella regensburgei]|uniref:hypothetical protein n=1 Tax=Yokenella regensburgei TaxID=158877 RepID=UPI003ED84893
MSDKSKYLAKIKKLPRLAKGTSSPDKQSWQELYKQLEAKDKRIAELECENEYIRKRFKEADRLFGKNLLVMQAAIIDWRTTSDAKNGMAWIFNTLLGPGELPSEDEKDAQAYFDREYAPIDEELMELHKWFWERNKCIKSVREGENEN